MLRILSGVLLTCFSGFALATDNTGVWTDRNIEMRLGLISHTYDQLVSGTNVNLTFAATAPALADPPPGAQWTSSDVVSLRVQCDDLDHTYYQVTGPHSPAINKVIRIASTHFNDGSSITFTLTGVFRLTDSSGSTDVTKTWTAKVKAYNKGLTIASNVEEGGTVIDEGSPYYPLSARRSSKELADYAITSSVGTSTTNAHHTMDPTPVRQPRRLPNLLFKAT